MNYTAIETDYKVTPAHQKPTFTGVYRKLTQVRVRISTLRGKLSEVDRALDDIHKIIQELDEIQKHD